MTTTAIAPAGYVAVPTLAEAATQVTPAAIVAAAAPVETTVEKIEGAAVKVWHFLEAVGKDFDKGLEWALTYAIPVEKLVALLFPGAAPAAVAVFDAASLIQAAVIQVEQKYAAMNLQSESGTQKAAEVLTLVGPAVTGLLTSEGIAVPNDYINKLITAVVGILNVQLPPATS